METYLLTPSSGSEIKRGSTFTLQVDLRNDADESTEELQVYVESLNELATVLTPTITVNLIESRSTASVGNGFEVSMGDVDPCAKTLQFHVHVTNSQNRKVTDPIDVTLGTEQLKFDWLHSDNDWTVNPEGDDSASAGTWKLGEPECSLVLDIVTQPERDHTPGEGELSFHTGPKKGQSFTADDVDGGRTTLESPVFAIGDATYPSLIYYAWHVAVDLTSMDGPKPMNEALVVSASNDGGRTWIEIDRVEENTKEWERREVPLLQYLDVTNRMMFRFEINDDSTVGTVEAGIDDIEILDLRSHCSVPEIIRPEDASNGASKPNGDNSGASCAASSNGSNSLWPIVVGLLGGILIRRRRNR